MAKTSVMGAARDVFASRRFAPVLVVATLIEIASRSVPQEWPWYILFAILRMMVLGYCITYAGRVAASGDGELPPPREPLVFLRRALLGTLICVLPAAVVFGVSSLGGLFLEWLLPSGDSIPSLVFYAIDIGQSILTTVEMVALLLALTAPLVLGSRYAFYDKVSEGFRYLDSFNRAWRLRRSALSTGVILIGWMYFLLVLQVAIGTLAGDRKLAGYHEAVTALLEADASPHDLKVIAAMVAICTLWTLGILVQANLIGRYGAIAYGVQKDEAGRSSNGFDLTSTAGEVV